VKVQVGAATFNVAFWEDVAPRTVALLHAELPVEGTVFRDHWCGDVLTARLGGEVGRVTWLEEGAASIYPGVLALCPRGREAGSSILLIGGGASECRDRLGRCHATPFGELLGLTPAILREITQRDSGVIRLLAD
jgi:hypothetical protein